MKNSTQSSEHVRPMLEAMARSIDAARAKRVAPASTGSSEGTTAAYANFTIGSQIADNGKAKATPKSAASAFFRERDSYRKAG